MSATFFDSLRDPKRSGLLAYALILLSTALFFLILLARPPFLLPFLGLIYLGSTFVIGALLYVSNPVFYLGFTWWIWIASPFVRRYIDYTLGGYTPPAKAFALLAPVAVSSLMILTVVRNARLLTRRTHLPIFLCFLGILYGLALGVVFVDPVMATLRFVEWLIPLLMAFHITVQVRRYPAYRAELTRFFIAAIFVLGVYGIAQYIYPAPWDRMWIEASGMTTIGKPRPMEVRVFGLLEAPGPYAMALMAGLLVAVGSRSVAGLVAVFPGLGGFLLSMVRSAWGGFVLGLGAALTRFRGGNRIRTIAVVLLVGAATVPLLGDSDIGSAPGDRIETLQNLENDNSLQARKGMYQKILFQALSQPLGYGIGSAHWDSGYVTILWQLGWLGGGLYLVGYFLFARSLLRIERGDVFTTISFGIATAFVALMFMGSQHAGFNGLLQWTFLAMVALSNRYYAAIRDAEAQMSSSNVEEPPVPA